MTGLPNATVDLATINTPIGQLNIQATQAVVTHIGFTTPDMNQTIDARVDSTTPASALLKEATAQLQAYFEGRLKTFDLPLGGAGTAFQQQVWQQLQKIPYGTSQSYAELAQAIQNPKACRAVGLANRANPLAIVVPCHRVIGANGKLTGYAGGLQRKQWLLQHEQR